MRRRSVRPVGWGKKNTRKSAKQRRFTARRCSYAATSAHADLGKSSPSDRALSDRIAAGCAALWSIGLARHPAFTFKRSAIPDGWSAADDPGDSVRLLGG